MGLKKIRLELARTREEPEGNPHCGYDIIAPIDERGQFDEHAWRDNRGACSVRRFWQDAEDEHGLLLHTRSHRWVVSYKPGDEDDEPIFNFDRHVFKAGEYLSITEHDGVTRPFKIVSIQPLVTVHHR